MFSRCRLPPQSLPVSSFAAELGQLEHPPPRVDVGRLLQAGRRAAGSRAPSTCRRRRRAGAPTRRAAGRTSPSSGARAPGEDLSRVVLPAPLGPMSPPLAAQPSKRIAQRGLGPEALPDTATFIRAPPRPPRPPHHDRRARSRRRDILRIRTPPARRTPGHYACVLAGGGGGRQVPALESGWRRRQTIVSRRIAAIGSAMNAPRTPRAPAHQQREDHQDRVDPQRLAEDVGRHDVALELLQDRERDDQPDRVDRVVAERGDHHGRKPPIAGPTYGISSAKPNHAPNAIAYVLPSGKIPTSRAGTASAPRWCP